MKKNVVLIVSFLLVAFLGIATINTMLKPETYHDCIKKNMRGVSSDKAALIIRATCREEHPIKPLTDDEFMGLKQ